MSSVGPTDKEIEEETGLSRAEHENRNEFNELPTGKMAPSAEDPTLWKDEKGRPWKKIEDPYSAYHQPMHLYVAFVRGQVGKVIPFLNVPNLKFLSPNADKMYSEICANRYTGELVIEQKIIGSFNLCKDAPDGMKVGKLPTDGEHRKLDIIPHEKYGGNYRHIAKGIPIGSLKKGPVVLGKLQERRPTNGFILGAVLVAILSLF